MMQATIILYQIIILDYFRFGLIFIKKISKPVFFKPKLVQTDRFRFGSVWLGFPIWLGFFGLTRFF
jgi:hypothetical protein